MMYKYILTSFVVLFACDAYGNFDFANYNPTLGTGSAYTLSFVQVSDNTAPNTITTYSVDANDYSVAPVYYTYSLNHGASTNARRNINTDNTNISGSFISLGGSVSKGGAIYNQEHTINSVSGDFIGNSAASSAGAIYNWQGTINSITGDFIDNHAGGSSGAIMNYVSEIGSITGNFIGNYSSQAGAISNGNTSTINSISGNFVGNHTTDSYGGSAIKNHGTITSVTADFIGNYDGGAIYNEGYIDGLNGNFIGNESKIGGAINHRQNTIGSVVGNFIGNTASNYAGAIYNRDTIESITGDFIGNSATNYAGAIFNDGNIGTISGNFIGNYTTQTNGGAIYTSESIRFLSKTDSYIISGNYGGDNDVAIITGNDYDVSTDVFITFDNESSTHYIVNDEIRNDITYDSPYSINVTGDGTGYTQFNNDLHNVNTVNINNGTMIFGQTPDGYTGTADIGHFVGANNPVMNLENGTFNIANGYTETVSLGGLSSVGSNNFIALDLDIANNSADFINVTDNISGQINLVVQSLSDLDIGNNIIWFANVNSDNGNLFNLYSVSGIDYELELYFDKDNHKYGLAKEGNTIIHIPVLSQDVVEMANYTAITVVHTIKELTNSMHKRVGELQWLTTDNNQYDDLNNALWARNIYKGFDINNVSADLSGMEFGYDRIISSTDNYNWYVGVLGYVSGGDSKFKNNNFNIDGYGIGAYVMMLEKSGWFGDLVLRQHFIDIENSGIKSDYDARSLNLEIGKEFTFGENTDELKWFVKPSIEGAYISISGTDVNSFKVKDSTSNILSLSVFGGPRWDFESGKKFQMYAKVGYNLDNSDDVDVVVNGISAKQDIATNTAEFGIGFDYRANDSATNIYFEASYITGSDYSETSGNIGVRYSF